MHSVALDKAYHLVCSDQSYEVDQKISKFWNDWTYIIINSACDDMWCHYDVIWHVHSYLRDSCRGNTAGNVVNSGGVIVDITHFHLYIEIAWEGGATTITSHHRQVVTMVMTESVCMYIV